MNKVTLLKGDCIKKLKGLKDNSVDSVVTDPPYHLTSWDMQPKKKYKRKNKGFMGKEWDGLGKDGIGIANNPKLWKEVLRVLKPGGHLLSFSHSRTYHRQAVAVEDAGFEIRDQIMWIYGSGFPKSHNIGNKLGEEYKGIGTALKPAHEPIVMARKPFNGTVAKNVLEWGTGGINIDECRVGTDEITTNGYGDKGFVAQEGYEPSTHQGRFPANIIFDEEAGKILDEQSGISKSSPNKWEGNNNAPIYGKYEKGIRQSTFSDTGGASRFFYCPKASKKDRNEGMPEQVPQFTGRPRREDGSVIYKETHPEEWAEVMKGKPRKEKTSLAASEEILQPTLKGTMNIHPTVKPTDLMAYLVRLVTPKGGVVLDPFMGSGSTGKGAIREGMDFIGIEREDEYMEIAKTRIQHEEGKHNYRTFFDI